MNKLFRFVTRPTGDDGKSDLVIGACFQSQSFIKPNTVYEATEIMGVITVKEVGESWMTMYVNSEGRSPAAGPYTCWGNDVGTVMAGAGKTLMLSREELEDLVASENKDRK